MTRTRRLAILAGLAIAGSSALGSTTIWCVDDDAPAGGDGLGWSTAFNSLDDALAVAQADDQVWVAAGTYTPSTRWDPADLSSTMTDPMDATFKIPKSVQVFGGFAGNEEALDERAGLFDQTILSGIITLADGSQANVRHVVFYHSEGVTRTPGRLDGFVVRGGKAGQGGSGGGGGLYAGDTDGPDGFGFVYSVKFDVANCRFEKNSAEGQGGGVSMNPLAATTITNTVFDHNSAVGNGGGMSIGSSPRTELIGSSFIDNTSGNSGGGLSKSSAGTANPVIVNCLFVGNAATNRGGAINFAPNGNDDPMQVVNTLIAQNTADLGGGVWMQGGVRLSGGGIIRASSANFDNCTIADNVAATEGGGMLLAGDFNDGLGASAGVLTSIVWGNTAPTAPQLNEDAGVLFSDIQGGTVGFGNIDVDPLFADPSGRDYHLAIQSPLIDASIATPIRDDLDIDSDGDTDELIPLDLDGGTRFYDVPFIADTGAGVPPYMDFGAYEYQPEPCAADLTGSIDPNDPGFGVADGLVDANDFFYYLDRFAAGDLAVADLTGSIDPNDPGFGVPDGALDASDFFFYLRLFGLGCP